MVQWFSCDEFKDAFGFARSHVPGDDQGEGLQAVWCGCKEAHVACVEEARKRH